MNSEYNIILSQLLKKHYPNITPTDLSDINTHSENTNNYTYLFLYTYICYMEKYFSCNEEESLDNKKKFIVRILNDNSINGLATRKNNTYYSVIHSGTISKNRMESQRIVNHFQLDYNKEESFFYLYCYSCMATFFHEMGHILNGHIDYNRAELHENCLFMDTLGEKVITQDKLIRKTLENDADEFSASRLSDYIFLNYEYLKKTNTETIKSKTDLLKLFFFSITMKFMITQITPYTPREKYLPNIYRIIVYINSFYAHSVAMDFLSMTKAEYNETFINCIKRILPQQHVQEFISQLIGGYQEEILLHQTWNLIHDDLMKYKHPNVFIPDKYVD